MEGSCYHFKLRSYVQPPSFCHFESHYRELQTVIVIERNYDAVRLCRVLERWLARSKILLKFLDYHFTVLHLHLRFRGILERSRDLYIIEQHVGVRLTPSHPQSGAMSGSIVVTLVPLKGWLCIERWRLPSGSVFGLQSFIMLVFLRTPLILKRQNATKLRLRPHGFARFHCQPRARPDGTQRKSCKWGKTFLGEKKWNGKTENEWK